jgi:hypothetical protein
MVAVAGVDKILPKESVLCKHGEFQNATSCYVCGSAFSSFGLQYLRGHLQRHHCRKCCRSVCEDDSVIEGGERWCKPCLREDDGTGPSAGDFSLSPTCSPCGSPQRAYDKNSYGQVTKPSTIAEEDEFGLCDPTEVSKPEAEVVKSDAAKSTEAAATGVMGSIAGVLGGRSFSKFDDDYDADFLVNPMSDSSSRASSSMEFVMRCSHDFNEFDWTRQNPNVLQHVSSLDTSNRALCCFQIMFLCCF